MAKKTALYDTHIKYGGKMVEFTGYMLPVQYSSIIKEHKAVREFAGLFDVSHMGEVLICGDDALNTINFVMANDYTNMAIGKVRYSLMLYPNGTIVDDVLVYKCDDSTYLVVVNACNSLKDYEWILENKIGKTTVINLSEQFSQVALQGPLSEEIMASLTDIDSISKGYYTFIKDYNFRGYNCIISRTGYTGERGFEIYMKNEDAPAIWEILMETGKVTPCGLGSRDTLRLEAGMPLYGHEINNEIMANEVGLDFSIKMNKDNFIGKDALVKHIPMYKRIGLELIDRGIAREGAKIYNKGEEVGYVTSGTHSPLTSKAIAMARIAINSNEEQYDIEVRNRMLKAKVVAMPFNKS